MQMAQALELLLAHPAAVLVEVCHILLLQVPLPVGLSLVARPSTLSGWCFPSLSLAMRIVGSPACVGCTPLSPTRLQDATKDADAGEVPSIEIGK